MAILAFKLAGTIPYRLQMRISISSTPSPTITKSDSGYSLKLFVSIRLNENEEEVRLKSIECHVQDQVLGLFEIQDEQGKKQSDLLLQVGEQKRLILVLNDIDEKLDFFDLLSIQTAMKFQFLNANEEDLNFDFNFKAKITLNSTGDTGFLSELKFKRKARKTLFFNLLIWVLILLIVSLWGSLNKGVYGQIIPPIAFNLVLTGLAVYLGFNLSQLKSVFTNIRNTKDFFNTTEIYFQRDTIDLLGKRNFMFLSLFGFLGLAYLALWHFFPLSLKGEDIGIYEMYIEKSGAGKIPVDATKIYWKDAPKVGFTLRAPEGQENNPSEVEYLARIQENNLPVLTLLNGGVVEETQFTIGESCPHCQEEKNTTFTIKEAYYKCFELKEDCYCKILTYLKTKNTNSADTTGIALIEENRFENKNTRKISINELDQVLESVLEKDNKKQAVLNLLDNEYADFRKPRQILIDFINSKLTDIAQDYDPDGGWEGPGKKLDGVNGFCAYLHEEGLKDRIKKVKAEELKVQQFAEKVIEKGLLSNDFSESFIRFLINVEGMFKSKDSSFNDFIYQYLLGNDAFRKRSELLFNTIIDDELKMNSALSDSIFQLLKTKLPINGKRDSIRTNKYIHFIEAASQNEEIKDSQILNVHNYVIDPPKRTSNQKNNIGLWYLKAWAESGLKPSDYQLNYFDKLVCKLGVGGKENESRYIYSDIFNKYRKVHEILIERAEAWDDPNAWGAFCVPKPSGAILDSQPN